MLEINAKSKRKHTKCYFHEVATMQGDLVEVEVNLHFLSGDCCL